jgi:hypothetical protein
MAGRGRPKGFVMSDEHRTKIANSQILNRLLGHVEGTVELSATQVSAGVALLKKVLPDMQSVEHSGDVIQRIVAASPLTPEQWAAKHGGD